MCLLGKWGGFTCENSTNLTICKIGSPDRWDTASITNLFWDVTSCYLIWYETPWIPNEKLGFDSRIVSPKMHHNEIQCSGVS